MHETVYPKGDDCLAVNLPGGKVAEIPPTKLHWGTLGGEFELQNVDESKMSVCRDQQVGQVERGKVDGTSMEKCKILYERACEGRWLIRLFDGRSQRFPFDLAIERSLPLEGRG